MLLVGLALFGIFFYNSLFLQSVLGYSAIETGATFLPMTVLIILVAPLAGRLSDRIGARWLMGAGMTLLAISLLLFGTLDEKLVLLEHPSGPPRGRGRDGGHDGADDGCGDGLPFRLTKAGVGSAVINSMRQVGGSLGIAIMGALVATSVSVRRRARCGRPVRGRLSPSSSRRRGARPRGRDHLGPDGAPSCHAAKARRNQSASLSPTSPRKRKTPGCGSGGRFLLGDSALCGGLSGTWLCGPATPRLEPTW